MTVVTALNNLDLSSDLYHICSVVTALSIDRALASFACDAAAGRHIGPDVFTRSKCQLCQLSETFGLSDDASKGTAWP